MKGELTMGISNAVENFLVKAETQNTSWDIH